VRNICSNINLVHIYTCYT